MSLIRLVLALLSAIGSAGIVHVGSTPSRPTVAAPPHASPALVGPAPPVARPAIQDDLIPFDSTRRAQTVAYVRRHYGSFMAPTYELTDPQVIVIHYTEASYRSTYNTFADDVPDPELHELPATCAHYVIDVTGLIHELVPPSIICRHTVGLNWTAIGIEHVGFSDAQVLGDSGQMTGSLQLVQWLRCRYRIPVPDVIGHAESLSSPYHREDVPSVRTQTHGDFVRQDMDVYRARLRKLGPCP
jgi:hypothetical protein